VRWSHAWQVGARRLIHSACDAANQCIGIRFPANYVKKIDTDDVLPPIMSTAERESRRQEPAATYDVVTPVAPVAPADNETDETKTSNGSVAAPSSAVADAPTARTDGDDGGADDADTLQRRRRNDATGYDAQVSVSCETALCARLNRECVCDLSCCTLATTNSNSRRRVRRATNSMATMRA
jgi:hypothetical protein